MEKEYRKWIFTCILGGLLMIIGSVTGDPGFVADLFNISAKFLGERTVIPFLLVLFIFKIVAVGGGISVIIGSILVAMDHYRLGKLIIGIGAGVGFFGLLFIVATGLIAGTLLKKLSLLFLGLIGFHGTFGFCGILLTIIARRKLNPLKTG